jgi:hypothetical protein
MTTKTKAIRALNDELRPRQPDRRRRSRANCSSVSLCMLYMYSLFGSFTTGTAVMTAGVAALGAETVARIVKTIGIYDDFCHANDPYEEHDFGSFEVDCHTVFFQDRLF